MFVVHAGLSPTEYWGLTLVERDAIFNELKAKNGA